MNEAAKQAAERLTASSWDVYGPEPNTDDDWFKLADKLTADGTILAQAYLREHPADDGDLIDADWLRSVGFESQERVSARRYGPDETYTRFVIDELWLTRTPMGGWGAVVGGLEFPDVGVDVKAPTYTRGSLRRLCAALGIPLKESP